MHNPGERDFESEALDPDALLWVRGVDYVTGWRDAKDAAAELAAALTAAGMDVTGETGVRARAAADVDGSGVVHLRLSAAMLRGIAALVRDSAAWRRAG
ncbi:hypothetical protein ABZW18_25925 [Streptomyces sp. NPDC004647]|uniref:hypothetical protein n=1 Tax=Streptomyces sp. NPDC004647 TaxID=3154671 RepID=UPI0033BF5838